MTRTQSRRAHIALMLYFCVMLSAFHCSMGHGQMSGMQLNGAGILFCNTTSPGLSGMDLLVDASAPGASASFDCSLVTSFVALALAAFFGLLGWLALRPGAPALYLFVAGKPHRVAWPDANPRAPPLSA
ncbi:MAG: DUF2946 family protein [Pseudoalteromonas distincta]|tara:strand:+ start:12933 stop:13319 length:387 start_codon:yes stop_codon:yes gene_type:complete